MSDDDPTVPYPFRKHDSLTGKWYRARWKASLADIKLHGGTIDGPPETYGSLGTTSGFQVERPPCVTIVHYCTRNAISRRPSIG